MGRKHTHNTLPGVFSFCTFLCWRTCVHRFDSVGLAFLNSLQILREKGRVAREKRRMAEEQARTAQEEARAAHEEEARVQKALQDAAQAGAGEVTIIPPPEQ